MSDHAQIRPDPLMAGDLPTGEGESVQAEWRADPRIYWQNHMILAAVFSVLAVAGLWWLGKPDLWAGPLAAVIAVFARAAFLKSEALGDRWRLTDRRLLGPRGRASSIAAIRSVSVILGDVVVSTADDHRYLLKYLRDPASVVATLGAARKAKGSEA